MTNNKINTDSVYDTIIRMLILFLIIAWCLLIMFPFVHIMMWGLIFGISFQPLHTTITKYLGGKDKLASAIIVLIIFAIVVIPSWMLFDSLIENAKELKTDFQAGILTIPPPTEKVKSWPIIGEKLYDAWSMGSSDLQNMILKYKEQLTEIGSKLAKGLLGATSGILQILGAVIIGGILLVVNGAGEAIRKFFRKIAGNRGDEFADIVKITIGNVVKGVLGVAFIQAFLIGIGFWLAGIPYAGLWTILVFIFAVLQLPPTLIVIPMIAFMFSEKETLPAILWSVYLFLAGMSDNILKPVLLGKGAPVPMLVIFIGVVGGFMLSGFIGLFSGAIIMSIGYKLFISWITPDNQEEITTDSQ